MIRFKVVKGSRILFVLSVVVLLAVLLVVIFGSSGKVKGTSSEQNATASAVAVYASADALHVRIIPDALPASAENTAPTVLIYHTHTHEAYEQVKDDPYIAIETWRTSDPEHSVVRVGAALAQELRNYGLNVIHDTTDHELNDINNAYVRSLETLESYDQSFDLCIDLHRDAYSEGLLKNLESENGATYAQVMMLVGQGNNYPDQDKTFYKSNLALAREITLEMNRSIPNICRNVTVKDGRYNQHIGKNALLIEVGHNMNTLSEALSSIPYLAETVKNVLM